MKRLSKLMMNQFSTITHIRGSITRLKQDLASSTVKMLNLEESIFSPLALTVPTLSSSHKSSIKQKTG